MGLYRTGGGAGGALPKKIYRFFADRHGATSGTNYYNQLETIDPDTGDVLESLLDVSATAALSYSDDYLSLTKTAGATATYPVIMTNKADAIYTSGNEYLNLPANTQTSRTSPTNTSRFFLFY